MRFYRIFNSGKNQLPGRDTDASHHKSLKRTTTTTDLFKSIADKDASYAVPLTVGRALYGLTDYPSHGRSWPLMSRRMLDALLAVEAFEYTWVPAKLSLESGTEVDSGKFGFVDVPAVSGLMDLERSVYTEFEMFPGAIDMVDKFVVASGKTPPVLFQPTEWRTQLIREDGIDALKKAGIVGVRFACTERDETWIELN